MNAPQVRVNMELQGTTRALFTFKRPEARTTRHYFSEVRPRFRTQGGEIKMLAVERDHAADILDSHLLSAVKLPELEPFEDDVETIKSVLKQPRSQNVLFTLINSGLFQVEVMEPAEAGDDSPAAAKFNFGSMFSSQPIYLRIKEWDAEGLELNHYIKVTMDEPSAVDQRELENAQPLVRKKRGDFEHQEDVGKCQQLFAKRVRSIEGASFLPMSNADVEAAPCERENRAEWLPFVPYHIVTTVLAEEQAKGQLGNG